MTKKIKLEIVFIILGLALLIGVMFIWKEKRWDKTEMKF
jgi:hypothetical protein